MSINWKEVYDSFDGTMPQCLGARCKMSCCNFDESGLTDTGGNRIEYNTTLFDGSEADFQMSLSPSLNDLGVDLESRNIDIPAMAGGLFPASTQSVVLVKNCFDTDTGKCRLIGRKPVRCRVFPLKLPHYPPANGLCPAVLRIIHDKDIVDKVAEVREKLGFRDNGLWRMNLDASRERIIILHQAMGIRS